MKRFGLGIFMIVLLLSIFGCSKKEVEKRYLLEMGNFSFEYYIKANKDVVEQLDVKSLYNYFEDGKTKEEIEEMMKEQIEYSERKKVIPSGVSSSVEINDKQLIHIITAKIDDQLGTENDLKHFGIIGPNEDKNSSERGFLSLKEYEKMLKKIGAKEIK